MRSSETSWTQQPSTLYLPHPHSLPTSAHPHLRCSSLSRQDYSCSSKGSPSRRPNRHFRLHLPTCTMHELR